MLTLDERLELSARLTLIYQCGMPPPGPKSAVAIQHYHESCDESPECLRALLVTLREESAHAP